MNQLKYGLYLQWCLFFTFLAAVMAHCGISPNRYGSPSKLDLFGKVWESLPIRWLNFDISVLHALFGVLRCTLRMLLQNSACRDAIWCLSHFVLVGERTPDLTTIKGNGFYN